MRPGADCIRMPKSNSYAPDMLQIRWGLVFGGYVVGVWVLVPGGDPDPSSFVTAATAAAAGTATGNLWIANYFRPAPASQLSQLNTFCQ